MRMLIPGMESELEWNENCTARELIVENPHQWSQILYDLQDHDDSGRGVSLTRKGTALNFREEVNVIYNPLFLDFNTRSVTLNLQKILSETGQDEDNYMATQELKTKIAAYIVDLVEARDYSFSVSTDDFSLTQLAKVVGLHIESNKDDVLEQIIDYLEVMRSLSKVQLEVFVNLRSYLSLPDLEKLAKEVALRHIDILLLEATQREKILDIPVNIIDKDLCEI